MLSTRAPKSLAALSAGLLLVGLSSGCKKEESEQQAAPQPAEGAKMAEQAEAAKEPIEPLPKKAEFDEAKMELGRRLYFDPILSGDGTVSCASCHSLEKGGTDARKTSLGIRGQVGPINAPTTLNSSLNIAQFWDGRAADLMEQAKGPVANPKEMGADFDTVVARLKKDDFYSKKFDAIYSDGVTTNNVADAIAEYEKALITPSPFDAYLRGDEGAISEDAKEGYALFKSVGCTTCHDGMGVGGGSFQKLGVVHDYFADRGGELTDADMGRYNVTKKEEDKHKFKVPLLRNVELTAPYFHDGSKPKLEDAIKAMGHYQLGKELTEDQVSKIAAFLKSLTGEIPDYAYLPKGTEIPDRSALGKEDESGDSAPNPHGAAKKPKKG